MKQEIFFSFADLQVTGGTWLLRPGNNRMGVTAVIDDSRKLGAGALFVAIRGEQADGHNHLFAAVAAGAAAVCVDRDLSAAQKAALQKAKVGCLRVQDSLTALHQLAKAHRLKFADLTLVAITGSCGKTSTKEMLASILEERWPGQVLKTAGNTNNHFGVPRNLLRLTKEHRAAVLELGTNHPGEIARLAEMVQPDIGIVSNIGRAHLEFLGDLNGVAREKGALLAATGVDGIVVYPADCAEIAILQEMAGKHRQFTFGTSDNADLKVSYRGRIKDRFAMRFYWPAARNASVLEWDLGGEHQALNAAAAATAAMALELTPAAIIRGLQHCRLPRMRMEVLEIQGVHWVNDAYNANPDSMRAGIKWFKEITEQMDTHACLLVLGDMNELGHTAMAEHRALLEWVRQILPQSAVITVGPCMRQVAGEFGLRHFANSADAQEYVQHQLEPGTWVFLKGSRGVHLEKVMQQLSKLVS